MSLMKLSNVMCFRPKPALLRKRAYMKKKKKKKKKKKEKWLAEKHHENKPIEIWPP